MAEQELEDGLYSIRLAGLNGSTWTKWCIDIMGALDTIGNNVWLWDYYGGGGQIVQVTNDSNGYVFTFPLTGKVMDLWGGTVDPETATYNIQQWTYNGGGAQHWGLVDVTAARGAAVVNGEDLRVFMITSKVDENYAVRFDGSSPSQGLNIKADTQGSGAAQQGAYYWVFAPIDVPYDGAYKIVPYNASTTVLAVPDTNTNGAEIQRRANVDDSNYQVFKLESLGDGTAGIRCVQNGKGLYSKRQKSGNTSFQENDFVGQSEWSAATTQKWVAKYQGREAKYDDETLPLYRIINQFGTYQPCMDVNGPGTKPQNKLYMRQMDFNRNAQLFWFVPTEAYGKDLAVPSNIQGYYNGEYGTLLGVNNATTTYPSVQPSWIGTGEEWKIRYRIRWRKNKDTSAGTRSTWSGWKSIQDGKSANGGWGYVGEPNTSAILADGRWVSSDTPTPTSIGLGPGDNENDLVQIEFQIRQLAHEWGDYSVDAHSGSASQIITLAYEPTLTINNVTMDNKGVKVGYTTSSRRKLSKIRIWSTGFFDYSASNNIAVSGTTKAVNPTMLPENGEEVTVYWSVTTVDGITATGSALVPVAVSWANAGTMSGITYQWIDAGKLLDVAIAPSLVDYKLWLDLTPTASLKDFSLIEIEPTIVSGRPHFYIPYPFNSRFKVVSVGIASTSLVKWENTFTARQVSGRMWNFNKNNRGWCSGLLTLDGPPEESVSTKYTSEERPTTAGTWNRVTFGNVKSQSRTFASVAVDEYDALGRKRIRELLDAKYAWYRNQEGEVCRVAIISVNETKHYWGEEFAVEMRRVDT